MSETSFLFPFEFFSVNYVTTLLLAVFCAYVGVFVVLKRIVFVGIAIAEFSVLGVAASLLTASLVANETLSAFLDKAGPGPSIGSVVFAFAGIVLLTLGAPAKRLSRDGLIGMFYATAAAIALLFVWRSAAGKEELEHIVAGSVLFVNPLQLLVLTIAYSSVAIVHALFFKEFLFISFDREMARTLGLRAGLWEFLLYATIGVVISIGTRIGGVLLVFGFLVIPPIGGLLMADGFGAAVRIALTQAVVASCAGLLLSFKLSYPTGPMIVASLTVLCGFSYLGYRVPGLKRALRVGERLLLVPAAAALLIAASNLVFGTHFVTKPEPVVATGTPSVTPVEKAHLLEHLLEDLSASSADVRKHAVEELAHLKDDRAIRGIAGALSDSSSPVRRAAASAISLAGAEANAPVIHEALQSASAEQRRLMLEVLRDVPGPHIIAELRRALSDSDPAVAQAALASLVAVDDRASVPAIERVLDSTSLPADVRLEAADALGRFGSPKAIAEYVRLLSLPDDPFTRSEAYRRLKPVLGGVSSFVPEFDPEKEPSENEEALEKLRKALTDAKERIEWDLNAGGFRLKQSG